MTDKEKLLSILDNCTEERLETILYRYLCRYSEDFDSIRLLDMIKELNENYLYNKVYNLEMVKSISKERAFYLKTYLEGNMWKDEESARKNLQPQIDNAKAIIDACKRK